MSFVAIIDKNERLFLIGSFSLYQAAFFLHTDAKIIRNGSAVIAESG
jgi:hypothetical protein